MLGPAWGRGHLAILRSQGPSARERRSPPSHSPLKSGPHRQQEARVRGQAPDPARAEKRTGPDTEHHDPATPAACTHSPAGPCLPGLLRFQSAASADEALGQARPSGLGLQGSPRPRTNGAVSAGESTIFKTVVQPIPPKFVWAVTKLQTNHVTGHTTPVICWLLVLSICGAKRRGKERRRF